MPTKRKARKRVAKALKTYVRREIARVKNPRVSLPKQWTKVEMRQDAHGNVQVRGNAPLRNSGKPAKNVKELVVYGKGATPTKKKSNRPWRARLGSWKKAKKAAKQSDKRTGGDYTSIVREQRRLAKVHRRIARS